MVLAKKYDVVLSRLKLLRAVCASSYHTCNSRKVYNIFTTILRTEHGIDGFGTTDQDRSSGSFTDRT